MAGMRTQHLTVSLFEDSSHVILGPCEARLELGRDQLVLQADTTSLLRDLLSGPLRLRVRRSLFGGETGAFHLADKNGRKYFNGELFAIWFGTTESYDNWIAADV